MLPIDYCVDVLEGLYQQARYDPDGCVRLWDYELELRMDLSPELEEIESRCCGFTCFMYYCLRTEHVYNAFYEQFGHGFVFVENEDFQRNGFDGHDCSGCRYEDPLFLLVDHNRFYSPENQKKKMASLRLEKELFKFYEDNAMTQKTIRDRNIVINKVYDMIDSVWGDYLPSFSVEFFGSTRTGLASDGSDLDLAIVIPQYVNASHETLKALKNMHNSIHNMHCLAARLREMGMMNVEAIQGARVPICKFVDPETGLQCDINAASSLGVENSQLIDEYRKLDSRVGPFLYALKYFVKKRKINDNQRGTLSSYAYCLLGIYYLMNHNHDSCIVPNLQEFRSNSDECPRHGCKIGITHFRDREEVRYHDCIEVISGSKYQVKKESRRHGGAVTQWDGFCLDNLGKIMLEFFKWASKIDNLTTHMSIRYSGMNIPDVPSKWFKKSMVIQDPFILSKNVASSCSEQGLNRILAEFQRAARLLEETDMTFVDMCNSRAEPASYSQFSNTAVEMPIRVAKHRNKKNMNRFRHRMQ
ncbi:hypothetical protein FB192DRAFT_1377725 [Mucor lusitanicus]|uniref:Poly(A) RNA polymerase mitochondrial-like central palm domain-containing protein n=1 Tax=Mucor circinelloides f. lusitanicus TaxID=29924 RepID=A0A8H4BHP4_MUCCL|nr:hypothetical protein FB192DRAFT_1377725 [Mucor lusitanicus]